MSSEERDPGERRARTGRRPAVHVHGRVVRDDLVPEAHTEGRILDENPRPVDHTDQHRPPPAPSER